MAGSRVLWPKPSANLAEDSRSPGGCAAFMRACAVALSWHLRALSPPNRRFAPTSRWPDRPALAIDSLSTPDVVLWGRGAVVLVEHSDCQFRPETRHDVANHALQPVLAAGGSACGCSKAGANPGAALGRAQRPQTHLVLPVKHAAAGAGCVTPRYADARSCHSDTRGQAPRRDHPLTAPNVGCAADNGPLFALLTVAGTNHECAQLPDHP